MVPPHATRSCMSAESGRGVTSRGPARTEAVRGSAARPAPKRREQPFPRLRRKGFLRYPPERANGLPALFEIGSTPLAFSQVRLEPLAVARRQPVFEVVRYELHELAARHFRQVAVDHDASVAAKYCSSA